MQGNNGILLLDDGNNIMYETKHFVNFILLKPP